MHSLPALSYGFAALEPHIDQVTMQIHHDKHHQAYIDKLNAALEPHPDLAAQPIEELLMQLHSLPDSVQTAVKNHGGGHANHSLFWEILSPDGGGQPDGKLAEAISQKFESFDAFRQEFNSTAAAHFGSGWCWLVVGAEHELEILATPNQDSPLTAGKTPIMGVDVWEHAYYLKYQNRRPEYLEAVWNVWNWFEIARRFEVA